MPSSSNKEELSEGFNHKSTADDGTVQIDWDYVAKLCQPYSDDVPKTVSPLDLSKQNLPKTPELGVPVVSPGYASQSENSETNEIRQAGASNAHCRQKRRLVKEGNRYADKWQRLIVPTSERGTGVDQPSQQGPASRFRQQSFDTTSQTISDDYDQGADDAGESNGDQFESLNHEQVRAEETYSRELGPSLLPRTATVTASVMTTSVTDPTTSATVTTSSTTVSPRVFKGLKFSVSIWDRGSEMTVEIKRRDSP